MNDSGRLGGGGTLRNRPRAGFLGSGGEVGLQTEVVEADASE